MLLVFGKFKDSPTQIVVGVKLTLILGFIVILTLIGFAHWIPSGVNV